MNPDRYPSARWLQHRPVGAYATKQATKAAHRRALLRSMSAVAIEFAVVAGMFLIIAAGVL
jgi:hypothetical protein